jgi:hypothetical protein
MGEVASPKGLAGEGDPTAGTQLGQGEPGVDATLTRPPSRSTSPIEGEVKTETS